MSDVHDEGIEILREADEERARFAGKRVRVVRVAVHEGKYEDVQKTLNHSLPPGEREMNNGDRLRIVQGPMKVLDP